VKGCNVTGDLDWKEKEDKKNYYVATIISVDLSIR
jgi:hypothetical protein